MKIDKIMILNNEYCENHKKIKIDKSTCVLGNTNTNTIYKSTCIVGERKHNDGEDVTKPVTAPTLENKHHKNNINQNLSITTVNKDTSVTYFYQKQSRSQF